MTRLAWVGVGALVVAGLCASQIGPPPGRAMRPNLAVPCGPQLLIAQPFETGTALLLHDCEDPPPDGLIVDDALFGLAALTDGSALAWSRRAAWLVEPTAGETTLIWRSPYDILQMLGVSPPDCDGPRVLALTAENSSGERPLRSHLYLLHPAGHEPPRLLAPESGYNFWAASAGDVDADGAEEVALCTWSHTARDPNYAQRFFVYGWDEDGDLFPRWRGSRLCRRYLCAGLTALGQAVSVEASPHGGESLMMYEWNQFGFWGLGHSRPFTRLERPLVADLDGDGATELVAVARDARGPRRVLVFQCRDGALVAVTQSAPLDEPYDVAVLPAAAGDVLIGYCRRGDPAPRRLVLQPVTDEEESTDA